MGYKMCCLLCLAIFLAVSTSSIHAFDITKLLGQYPEFATFNKYLTETKLADQINIRNTITVLAVNDGALSGLSGKSQDVIKASLATQVILDYYDQKKLMEAQGSGQQLTTLYQASGLAENQQGFIKVALIGEGGLAFGSAVTGAPIDAELMKTVVTQPYNISILQVTKLIVVPGIEAKTPSSNAQSPPPAATAKAPAKVATPPPTEEVATPLEAPATPAEAPVATEAVTPSPATAEVKAADATTPSSSTKTHIGLVALVMAFASLLVAM